MVEIEKGSIAATRANMSQLKQTPRSDEAKEIGKWGRGVEAKVSFTKRKGRS